MTVDRKEKITYMCGYFREDLEVDINGFVLYRDLEDRFSAHCRERGIEPPLLGPLLFRVFPDTKFYFPVIGGRIEPAYWGVSFKKT